jgi:acyl carrier protein
MWGESIAKRLPLEGLRIGDFVAGTHSEDVQFMNNDNPLEVIRAFILKKAPAPKRKTLNDDSLLLGSGIIDSLAMLDVLAFLEKSFAITISDEELTPENFGSIRSVASFVESKWKSLEISAH